MTTALFVQNAIAGAGADFVAIGQSAGRALPSEGFGGVVLTTLMGGCESLGVGHAPEQMNCLPSSERRGSAHNFHVRAIANGLTDGTPASYDWTVKKIKGR